jgi:transaldolase
MGLFLDSANVEEARRARDSMLVVGVTTNPTLVAQTGRTAFDVVRDLAELDEWLVFHQLVAKGRDELLEEASRFADIAEDRVILKIMMSLPNLEVVAAQPEFAWAVTGIASAAQGLLAMEAGADFIIPYVNRITHAGEDGIKVVRDIADLLPATRSEAELLAASLKTPREVVDTILAGANHVTLPWPLFEEMARHPVTDESEEGFRRAFGGK